MGTIDKQIIKVFPDAFNGALGIVSAYGKVLEMTDIPMEPFKPVSKLPCSKEIIKKAISFLYIALAFEHVRQWVKDRYPSHANNILSKKYYHSLREGYLWLPTFLSEEEYNVALSLHKLHPGKEKFLEMMQNLDETNFRLLAEKVAAISPRYLEIMSRIIGEQRYCQLNCVNVS